MDETARSEFGESRWPMHAGRRTRPDRGLTVDLIKGGGVTDSGRLLLEAGSIVWVVTNISFERPPMSSRSRSEPKCPCWCNHSSRWRSSGW
jgi:hypothetical protein